jgi:hypothetical protein
MSETKIDLRLRLPLDAPVAYLPEAIELPPAQLADLAEAQKREERYREEWAEINKALLDNSLAVTRAMSRWHRGPDERERHTERVLMQFESGAFLLDRLGAAGVIDQDLAVVLLRFRRGLIEEYGDGPPAMMLIDRAVAAYQAFIRVEGWIGNLALQIEHEFFGTRGPSAHFQDRYGRSGSTIRGLSVEEHLARLRDELILLAERFGRVMREVLASLEVIRAVPSRAVEKSKPIKVSVVFGSAEPGDLEGPGSRALSAVSLRPDAARGRKNYM